MKFPEKLKPYKGIIYFVVILLVSHFFWKLFVLGDENGEMVTFFGWNISQPFIFMAHHIAVVTQSILNAFGYDIKMYSNNVLEHVVSKNGVWVIWGCTGIKQAYIFFCIIAFYSGPWKHKLWYIPLGVVFVYLFNIFRIVLIMMIIDKHPNQFNLWHEHILKYVFYLMIFVLWVFWNEKFVEKKGKNTSSKAPIKNA